MEGIGAGMAQSGPHIALCEDFFQKCLQEQADAAPCEQWSTGESTYRTVLDESEGSGAAHTVSTAASITFYVHVQGDGTAERVRETAQQRQVPFLDLTGAEGLSTGARGLLICFRSRGAELAPADEAAAEAAGEPAGGAEVAGAEEGGEGAVPSPGQRRRTLPRRPRRRALTLVKAHSRVTTLERDAKEVCPICLEVPRCGEMARTLPCFHMLHDACSIRYFRTRGVVPSCPVCRCDVMRAPGREVWEDLA